MGRVFAPLALLAPALAQVQFEELGKQHLPPDFDLTQAVACCDVDGDGDPDLVFGNSGQQNRLYLNDGTGIFTDVTASRMPRDSDFTSAVACCDVDGDGAPDLVFGNWGQQNRLYLNDGSGTFTDATASRMPMDSDLTVAVACCDVDGDGDLVFGNGQQNRLYLNDGSGTFTDTTASRMPTYFDETWALACCDVDGDADPDLVFGNGFGLQNRLPLPSAGGASAAASLPVPQNPALAGAALFTQALYFTPAAHGDTCSRSGIATSRGLAVTIQP